MPSRRRLGGGGVFHEAAVDAAAGRCWPVDGFAGECSPGVLATQRRHVKRSGSLLGLSLDLRTAERVGELLEVTGLELEQARAAYRGGGFRERALSVVQVLGNLDPGRDDRLLAAGHVAGLWGRAWRIDPRTGRRQGLPWRDPPTSLALSRARTAL